MAFHRCEMLVRFFDRQISDQCAIDSRLLEVFGESLSAVSQHWIEIRENDQSSFGALLSDLRPEFDDLLQGDMVLKRAFARTLDHRTISEWIRERDTEFDHARSGVNRLERNLACHR